MKKREQEQQEKMDRKHGKETALACLSLLLLLSACATAPTVKPVSLTAVRFPDPLSRVETEMVGEDDPLTLALFARGLYRKGKYGEAGDYFLKAARFHSEGEALRCDMLRAAALSFFRCGDLERFRETVSAFTRTLSEFEQADPDPETVALLQFYRRINGQVPQASPLRGGISTFSGKEE